MSKPTPEFINWLMARPEFRRRLNEEWEPEVGDWVVFDANEYCHRMDAGDHVGVVCEVLTRGGDDTWGLSVRDLTPSEGWGPHRLISIKGHKARWLPSLSQLLGMVEAEGYGWQMRTRRVRGVERIAMSMWRPNEAFSGKHTRQGEPEIAAASLLERLWEER